MTAGALYAVCGRETEHLSYLCAECVAERATLPQTLQRIEEQGGVCEDCGRRVLDRAEKEAYA